MVSDLDVTYHWLQHSQCCLTVAAGKQDGLKVVSEPAKLLGRQTSRSKSGSGAVRSDYEEQLIMSQLQAAERMRSQLMVSGP